MKPQPTLETQRLQLRAFAATDADRVQRLAGDRAVSATTVNIPYPYEDGRAEAWIASHRLEYKEGRVVTFAIVLRSENALIGAIGLTISEKHSRAELGYWIGSAYWNQGYCTEAVRALLRYGFEDLTLNKIHASFFKENLASGRVMEKVRMLYEGCRRQHFQKENEFRDRIDYGILRSEFSPIAADPKQNGERNGK